MKKNNQDVDLITTAGILINHTIKDDGFTQHCWVLVSLFFALDHFSLSIFHVRYVLIHIDVDQIQHLVVHSSR